MIESTPITPWEQCPYLCKEDPETQAARDLNCPLLFGNRAELCKLCTLHHFPKPRLDPDTGWPPRPPFRCLLPEGTHIEPLTVSSALFLLGSRLFSGSRMSSIAHPSPPAPASPTPSLHSHPIKGQRCVALEPHGRERAEGMDSNPVSLVNPHKLLCASVSPKH